MPSNLSAQTLPDATHPLGVQATDTRLQESYDLHMPDKRHDEKIPTLNQTGYMTSDRDPFTKAFIRVVCRAQLVELFSKSPFFKFQQGSEGQKKKIKT